MFVLSPSSWHEIGMYDLPAMVDYVLRVTGDPDLHFVGHSMGATTAVVMLSERPEYNSKLKIALLLAPVVKLEHNTSIFRHSAPLWKALQVSRTATYTCTRFIFLITSVGRLRRLRGLRLVMHSTMGSNPIRGVHVELVTLRRADNAQGVLPTASHELDSETWKSERFVRH